MPAWCPVQNTRIHLHLTILSETVLRRRVLSVGDVRSKSSLTADIFRLFVGSIISLQTADDHQNHLRPQKNSRIFSTAQIRFKWHEAVTSFQRKGSSFIFGHVVSEENNTGVGMGFIWARPLSLTQASGLKHQTKHQNYLACDHSLCASSLWVHVDLVLLYAPMCLLDFANSYNSLSSGSVFGSLGPASCD